MNKSLFCRLFSRKLSSNRKKMKLTVASILLLGIVCQISAQRRPITLNQVKATLKNDKFYQMFLNCILDQGKCIPDAADLKSII